jgi:uncharacterized protein YjbI with pentapeptide repeats
MAWFNKLTAFFKSLFGKPKPKPAPASVVPAPEPEVAGEVCALNMWVGEISQKRQLDLLFNCGVGAWNARRATGDKFWPDLSGANLHDDARKGRAMVWGKPADLAGKERVVLAGINLASANLEDVTFVAGDVLVNASATDPAAVTRGADLRRANLSRSKLRKAKLALSNLEGAALEGADLREADLRRANFARADLRNANLLDAKLDGANFAWADLSGTIVSAKALEGANLFGARLSHASVLGYQPTGLVFGRNLMGRSVRLVPTLKSAWV